MISLPTPNYPIVEDTNEDTHIDQCDVNVAFTFGEHELMCELLCQASNMLDFASPCFSMVDLPIASEIVQRYTMIDNIRERFNISWQDRFNTEANNEIY